MESLVSHCPFLLSSGTDQECQGLYLTFLHHAPLQEHL